MVFGPASQLGVGLFEETEPVELLPGRSLEEVETVIKAVYRQVLGNAYVMDSERLSVPESKLKEGTVTVREFVRQVGRSDLYRSRFFDSCPRYRLLDEGSFEADIDSYIDSEEYSSAYGENIVPYYRGYKTQTGKKMVGFTHIFQLLRGASSSDLKGSLSGKSPALNKYVIQETPLAVVPPSGGSNGWSFQDAPNAARSRHGVGASSSGKVYRVEVTAYRSKVVNRVSRFRRSNQVFLVPFDQLSQEYQRIHHQGGVISSITPIS